MEFFSNTSIEEIFIIYVSYFKSIIRKLMQQLLKNERLAQNGITAVKDPFSVEMNTFIVLFNMISTKYRITVNIIL